ncbi:flagellar biosynthesis protein FlgG [Helicobacter pylori]|nr:flagellar biosynthesis protein FlgG [Helicobacter pylori]
MATTDLKHKTTPSTKTTREQRLKSVKESEIPFSV